MEGKPIHYDGSMPGKGGASTEATTGSEAFKLTNEARLNISGNPFELHKGE